MAVRFTQNVMDLTLALLAPSAAASQAAGARERIPRAPSGLVGNSDLRNPILELLGQSRRSLSKLTRSAKIDDVVMVDIAVVAFKFLHRFLL